jgi:hypothetical protein
MASMRLADKMTVHQVHPAKIGADVTASVISKTLLWQAAEGRAGGARRAARGWLARRAHAG